MVTGCTTVLVLVPVTAATADRPHDSRKGSKAERAETRCRSGGKVTPVGRRSRVWTRITPPAVEVVGVNTHAAPGSIPGAVVFSAG
jgi:hypothetical protein